MAKSEPRSHRGLLRGKAKSCGKSPRNTGRAGHENKTKSAVKDMPDKTWGGKKMVKFSVKDVPAKRGLSIPCEFLATRAVSRVYCVAKPNRAVRACNSRETLDRSANVRPEARHRSVAWKSEIVR